MNTVLVTGGAGFIGSHLCEYLLKKGQAVLCLDNLLTSKRGNIHHLEKNRNFTFIKHDIITQFYTEVPITHLYNFACPASPVHYQHNAIRTIKANTLGVINMLGLAKKHHARFLQASTSEIYGDPLEHPQRESYFGNVNTMGPRACYDEGKRVAESLCYAYHHENDVDMRVVRIFNTYGPRMALNDGRVISNFIVQALKHEPITLYGKGIQTRSFCYVDDLVEGLYRMMQQQEVVGPINLGNPEEYSIRQLAELIKQQTKSSSPIIEQPLLEDDPMQRKPDITLAKTYLCWEPKISLAEGLHKTISYFQELLK